ncbi:MAG: hypothetical protein ACJAWV_002165 [Flammeovirgaceae bacterium]|jgi:hypothetical protein
MKSNITSFIIATLMLFGANAFSQMRKPAPSPAASASATIGVTKVSVDYSAPGVKGRKIFGELLPFGKVWRAGANSATKITFADDLKVHGKDVKAGTYSLFMTPKKSEKWTVYLDASGKSVYDYDEDEAKIKAAEGMIMFDVEAKKAPFKAERLAYYIASDEKNLAGTVSLHWNETLVSIQVAPATEAIAKKSMEGYFGWYTLANTAEYYMTNEMSMEVAKGLTETSLATNKHFYNTWVMAQIQAKMGNKKEALTMAMEAKKLGDAAENQNFYGGFKEAIATAIKDWK